MSDPSRHVQDSEVDIADTRHRYYDNAMKMMVVNVFQGDYYVTDRRNELLTTVLGSCISACVRDPIVGYGGMNHFLLPSSGGAGGGGAADANLRYGSFSMEQLINSILSKGGRRERLEVKVFGGGNVMKGLTGVGHKNADFIEGFLRNEGLTIAGSHLRGNFARKVQYFPATGKVRMKELAGGSAGKVFDHETAHAVKVEVVDDAGSIELFD